MIINKYTNHISFILTSDYYLKKQINVYTDIDYDMKNYTLPEKICLDTPEDEI